jgi:hypothetical protein
LEVVRLENEAAGIPRLGFDERPEVLQLHRITDVVMDNESTFF